MIYCYGFLLYAVLCQCTYKWKLHESLIFSHWTYLNSINVLNFFQLFIATTIMGIYYMYICYEIIHMYIRICLDVNKFKKRCLWGLYIWWVNNTFGSTSSFDFASFAVGTEKDRCVLNKIRPVLLMTYTSSLLYKLMERDVYKGQVTMCFPGRHKVDIGRCEHRHRKSKHRFIQKYKTINNIT